MLSLEHDAEKWAPVFRKDHAQTKKVERDDDSKKSHLALVEQNVLWPMSASRPNWVEKIEILQRHARPILEAKRQFSAVAQMVGFGLRRSKMLYLSM
jgi:hypothetical protein